MTESFSWMKVYPFGHFILKHEDGTCVFYGDECNCTAHKSNYDLEQVDKND